MCVVVSTAQHSISRIQSNTPRPPFDCFRPLSSHQNERIQNNKPVFRFTLSTWFVWPSATVAQVSRTTACVSFTPIGSWAIRFGSKNTGFAQWLVYCCIWWWCRVAHNDALRFSLQKPRRRRQYKTHNNTVCLCKSLRVAIIHSNSSSSSSSYNQSNNNTRSHRTANRPTQVATHNLFFLLFSNFCVFFGVFRFDVVFLGFLCCFSWATAFSRVCLPKTWEISVSGPRIGGFPSRNVSVEPSNRVTAVTKWVRRIDQRRFRVCPSELANCVKSRLSKRSFANRSETKSACEWKFSVRCAECVR